MSEDSNPFSGFRVNNNGFGFEFRSNGSIDPNDILAEMFGMGGGRSRKTGNDVNINVQLSFLEAINGCKREIRYEYMSRQDKKSVRQVKNVKVDIPAGVDNGMTIRVPEQGEDGPNGKPNGDLYVSVVVTADSYFRREGLNIYVDIPITLSQALLGGTVEVLTLDGLVDMKVPAYSQPDSRLVMKGKGVKDPNNARSRGNLIVNLKLKMPTTLSEKQQQLIKEYEEEEKKQKGSVNPRPFSLEQAWKRLKDFLGPLTSDKEKQTN
eukprot:gene17523-23084_t